MRVKNLSVLALALAAGLSLSACQGGDNASESTKDSSSAQGSVSGSSSSASGQETATTETASADGSSGETEGKATAASNSCKTSGLGFSSTHGMGEGDVIVALENTGSGTCTLKGFPGVDLKGKDGTISAERSDLSAPQVSIAPGEKTRFTLHHPRNDSGGTGVTFDRLVVTPPDETHSHSLPVTINLPVTEGGDSGTVRVDPVGTGK